MTYKILNLFQKDIWTKYINKLPINIQDIYYTPEYYELYEKNGDGKARCFIFEKNDDIALYPFLLNSVNDLGYDLDKMYFDIQGVYGYNGIILSTKVKGFFNDFYKTFTLFCKENNIIAEFTRFHPLIKNEAYSKDHLTVIRDRETVVIDLSKEYSEIWEFEYTSKNRNMIRKANRLGYNIQVLQDPSNEDLNTFMDIYYYSMKFTNAEKYYFFNKQYLINAFTQLKGHAFLFNVFDNNNEVLCSSVFLQFGNYFHYHLSGRSSKADNSVNNYLLDQALLYAKENGVKYFHLGGGRSKSENDTLLKFKCNFSTQKGSFYIGKKIHNTSIYNEVVKQWGNKHPEKVEKYKDLLLKYRY